MSEHSLIFGLVSKSLRVFFNGIPSKKYTWVQKYWHFIAVMLLK